MILIISNGSSFNYLNQITKIDSKEYAINLYGYYSPLTNALCRAFDLGLKSCYACNVQLDQDYFEVINQINGLSLDYILLPELTSNKKIKMKNGIEIPIYIVLSNILSNNKFIITDRHARDFVSMSHFLRHYNELRFEISKAARYKNNLCLVANCLKDSDYSSVDVACSLLMCDVGDYPKLQCGETYYNLEKEDFIAPIVFFKNGVCVNLFNFGTGIESNMVIERLVLSVKKELDDALEYLIGRRFNRNTLYIAYDRSTKILDSKIGRQYEKYKITDLYIQNGNINIHTDILPYFSFDYIKIHNLIKGV